MRRKNQQDKATAANVSGRPLDRQCRRLTADEEAEFEALDSRWREWQRMKEVFVKKRREIKKELKEYHSELKKNNKSVYAAIDNHWKDNGKSKGSYHGGKWNGIDSRDGMSDPDKYYGAMRGSLKSWINESVASDADIDSLVDDVIDLLKRWHDVFHLLRAPKYVAADIPKLDGYIKSAMEKHRDLGLSVTQKAHLAEDHAVEQCEYLAPIPISFLIEESVEQNHQIGFKHEEQVKRIKDADTRAQSKAKRIWISRNVAVQKKIAEVNEFRSRGKYNTKPKVHFASSPPVYSKEAAAIVSEQKDLSDAARKESRRIQTITRGVKRMIEAAPALSPLKKQRTESAEPVAVAVIPTTTTEQQNPSSPEDSLVPRQLNPSSETIHPANRARRFADDEEVVVESGEGRTSAALWPEASQKN